MLLTNSGKTLVVNSGGYFCLFKITEKGIEYQTADTAGFRAPPSFFEIPNKNICCALDSHLLRKVSFSDPLNPIEKLKFQFRQPDYVAYNPVVDRFFLGNAHKMCFASPDGKSIDKDLFKPIVLKAKISVDWSPDGKTILMASRTSLVALQPK